MHIIQRPIDINKNIPLNTLREELIKDWFINENWEGNCIDNLSIFVLYKYPNGPTNKIIFRGKNDVFENTLHKVINNLHAEKYKIEQKRFIKIDSFKIKLKTSKI